MDMGGSGQNLGSGKLWVAPHSAAHLHTRRAITWCHGLGPYPMHDDGVNLATCRGTTHMGAEVRPGTEHRLPCACGLGSCRGYCHRRHCHAGAVPWVVSVTPNNVRLSDTRHRCSVCSGHTCVLSGPVWPIVCVFTAGSKSSRPASLSSAW